MSRFKTDRCVDTMSTYRAISGLAQSENNDCVVRALAASFALPYDQAHQICKDHFLRRDREGTYNSVYFQVLKEWEEKGVELYGRLYNLVSIPPHTYYTNYGRQVQRRMTLSTLLKMEGTFFVSVKGHAMAISNGVVLGNWNDSQHLKKRIVRIWKVERVA